MERQQWINKQSKEWTMVGNDCRQKRKELGISAKEVASLLGVSVNRIYRFEKGQPIRDAKLLENAYYLALDRISNKYKGNTIVINNENKVLIDSKISQDNKNQGKIINTTKVEQNTVFKRLFTNIFG